MHAEELVKGDPDNSSNAFQYAHVQLNLPGQPNYHSYLPWVFKECLIENWLVIYSFMLMILRLPVCQRWISGQLVDNMVALFLIWAYKMLLKSGGNLVLILGHRLVL